MITFIIKGFYLLFVSQYSHLDINRDILIKYRVSSVNSVDLLSGTMILFIVVVSDWCIMNLDHGWWINILLNLLLIYPPIKSTFDLYSTLLHFLYPTSDAM